MLLQMKTSVLILASTVVAASAFSPSPMKMSADGVSARRGFLQNVGTAGVAIASSAAFPVIASAEIEVPGIVTEFAFPDNWGLSFNYEEDAKKVRDHMYVATDENFRIDPRFHRGCCLRLLSITNEDVC
jgi:photosystem II Psb27 protein